MEEAYTSYFEQQAGGGGHFERGIGNVYQASFTQQNGRGCCGIGGRVLTAVATPLVARGVKAVTEEVANASFGLLQDIQQDHSLPAIGHAAVSRAAEMGRNLKRRARNTLVGRGRGKQVKRKKKPAGKPKRKTKTRIKRKTKRTRKQTGGGARRVRTQLDHPDIFS